VGSRQVAAADVWDSDGDCAHRQHELGPARVILEKGCAVVNFAPEHCPCVLCLVVLWRVACSVSASTLPTGDLHSFSREQCQWEQGARIPRQRAVPPKPETRNPKPETRNPKPKTRRGLLAYGLWPASSSRPHGPVYNLFDLVHRDPALSLNLWPHIHPVHHAAPLAHGHLPAHLAWREVCLSLRGRDRLRASVQHASRQGDAWPVAGGKANAEDARSDRTTSGSLAVNYGRVPFQRHSRTPPCWPAHVQADPSTSSEPRCRLRGFRVFALLAQRGAFALVAQHGADMAVALGAGQNAGAKAQGRTRRLPRASACSACIRSPRWHCTLPPPRSALVFPIPPATPCAQRGAPPSATATRRTQQNPELGRRQMPPHRGAPNLSGVRVFVSPL
jgi:hypothetical protein